MQKESLTEEERKVFREATLQKVAAGLKSGGAVSVSIEDLAKALGMAPEEMRKVLEEDPDVGHIN